MLEGCYWFWFFGFVVCCGGVDLVLFVVGFVVCGVWYYYWVFV